MTDIDALDRALLAMLRTNARASAATLSRALRLPRTTVSARITRLEKSGVIAGYGLRLGANSAPPLSVVVGIKVAPKAAASVAQAMEVFAEIETLLALSGELELLAYLRLNSTADLESWVARAQAIEGVMELRASIVLSSKIDRRAIA
jgi:DNA-binding Lrp family transcriptional regulator